MAVSIFAREVFDLCLGKPALRSLSVSATVGDALSALKRIGESYLSVWSCDHDKSSRISDDCRCLGKVCMVDIICFLCKEENLKSPAAALQSPLSVLIPKTPTGIVRHLEPHARFVTMIPILKYLVFFFRHSWEIWKCSEMFEQKRKSIYFLIYGFGVFYIPNLPFSFDKFTA